MSSDKGKKHGIQQCESPYFCQYPIVWILTYNDAMTVELDLNFLPFHRIAGKDWPSLPGLLTSAPTRRVARGREGDHLFIYLSLSGNTSFSSDEYTKLVDKMSVVFYETPGSLTSAMRTAADTLNQSLLNRNLSTTGRGQYIVGRLVLGVLRSRYLVLVQSGPTHIFLVGRDEVQHLHDPELSGRGLGFSQTTPLYFSQLDLHPGELLVISPQLPDGWEPALLSERGVTTLEALQRKLQAIQNENINAVVIQVLSGRDGLKMLSPSRFESVFPPPAAVPEEPPASMLPPEPGVEKAMDYLRYQEEQDKQVQPSQIEPVAMSSSGLDDPLITETFNQDLGSNPALEPARQPSRFSQLISASPLEEKLPVGEAESSMPAEPELEEFSSIEASPEDAYEPDQSVELPEIQRKDSTRRTAFMGKMLTGVQGVRRFGQTINTGFQTLLKRMLPGLPEDRSPLMQGSTMAFIAVIVPLMVVVIASTVYMRFGRTAQYDENYKQAINEAVGAIGQSDPAIVQRAWESALFYLDKAEQYQVTQNSSALRHQAQSALDAMDLIIRLDFRPAIYGGLAKTVQVGQMAATETDLYMLNIVQGNILRASMSSNGYMVDANFKCGPGSYKSIDELNGGSSDVGSIVDIVALPRVNPFDATLIGMDTTGTLIICAPNTEPRTWKLEEPDIRWKNPLGFALSIDDYSVYVLDPGGNAVWVYGLDNGTKIYGKPEPFFSEKFVPANMNQAVDISVSGTDLYLLFSDGHVTNCLPGMGDVIPIRCNDPETITDTRSGHQSGPVLSDAQLTEMTFTSPPDPSLYVLAPDKAAIYRFSPRPEALFLQNQFRAAIGQERTMFTSPVSAIAISPNRFIFLCVGNQVYYTMDVP